MHVTEVDPDDHAAFSAWYGVVEASHRAARPDEPTWQRQELHALAVARREEAASVTSVTLAAVDGGRTVGAARLDLPRRDNPHLAELAFLVVAPGERRRGAGRALLEHARRLCVARGRRDLVGQVSEQPGERAPGRAFAEAVGARLGQRDVRRDLHLPVDPARLDALQAACTAASAAYDVLTWGRTCPPELLEDRVLLARRMSTDAPRGEVDVDEEVWDAARVREGERLLTEQGRDRLAAGAVARATGCLVGISEVCVPLAVPARAYQWDTLVLREHRGHRLGLLLKVANLRRAATEWPATRTVSTWNADDNAPMIAVNEALGAVVVGTACVWVLRA